MPCMFDPSWFAASYAHDNCVVQIIVGQEARLAHGAVEPGTVLNARSRCTTESGFCARADATLVGSEVRH